MPRCRRPAIAFADRLALSLGESAAVLGVAISTLYTWHNRGLVEFAYVGGRTFITTAELRRLLAADDERDQTGVAPAAEPATSPLRRNEMLNYLQKAPTTPVSGQVICHNAIKHGPHTKLGHNGFRAWLCDTVPDGFVPCPCEWAAEAGEHYASASYVEIARRRLPRRRPALA